MKYAIVAEWNDEGNVEQTVECWYETIDEAREALDDYRSYDEDGCDYYIYEQKDIGFVMVEA